MKTYYQLLKHCLNGGCPAADELICEYCDYHINYTFKTPKELSEDSVEIMLDCIQQKVNLDAADRIQFWN